MVDGKYASGKKILHVFDEQSSARHFAETRGYVLSLAGTAFRTKASAGWNEPADLAPNRVKVAAVPLVHSNRGPAETGIAVPASAPVLIQDDAGLFDFVAAKEGEFVSTYGIFDAKRFSAYFLNKKTFRVSVGDKLDERAFVSKLLTFLYAFQEYSADPWTYRRDGDNVTVRTSRERVMISFFDGEVDGISMTGFSGGKPVSIQTFVFPDRTPGERLVDAPDSVSTAVAEGAAVFFHDPDFARHFPAVRKELPDAAVFWGIPKGDATDLGVREAEIHSEEELRAILENPNCAVNVFSRRPESVKALVGADSGARIAYFDPPKSIRLGSFVTQDDDGHPEWFLSDDVLSPLFVKERTGKSVADRMDLLLKIAPGDYVVHRDHGVGIFHGTEKKSLGGNEREFVRLEYAGNDVLFVPLSEVFRISKYIGEDKPKLQKLGGTEWKKAVEKAEMDAEKVAVELLDIYAKRKLASRPPNVPREKEEESFRKAFQYAHTADQLRAVEEILADLAGSEPMDRLLSGDVGFGKTEVAMNAAYRSILNGRQVAFVSPLVVLAYEHFESLTKRFEPYGINVAVLTRFSKEAEEKLVLKGLRDGTVDIVVGTHRLLSTDVRFRNLGLLVVDEEHRFGVLDKEKIAAFRENVDILSLSATPIPRSLNLALSGVRKVSLLTTPPPRKKPIVTSVARWDKDLVRNAVEMEIERGGQIIVLHNRVRSLSKIEAEIRTACEGRDLKIATVHGQMSGTELEDRILEFKHGDFDVLLSTTVVENGVNFLRANTILIDEADEFGLASLHQLRGRVGRKDVQAYCHLLYRKEILPDDSKKRLVAIASNSHLGAGFEISMRDLEIRGAGEIL